MTTIGQKEIGTHGMDEVTGVSGNLRRIPANVRKVSWDVLENYADCRMVIPAAIAVDDVAHEAEPSLCIREVVDSV